MREALIKLGVPIANVLMVAVTGWLSERSFVSPDVSTWVFALTIMSFGITVGDGLSRTDQSKKTGKDSG